MGCFQTNQKSLGKTPWCCEAPLSSSRSHSKRSPKHGVFYSVVDLEAAINRFIPEHNDSDPKPFVWKANPNDITAARNQGVQMSESIHYSA